jgi:hypothetical protein
MFKKNNRRDWIIIVIIIILNVLPRLIYFLNKGFFVNGDEAIVGVMVRDALTTGHIPLFFYGNNYLLVFFEVLWAAVVSFLFGANIFTLKIAMLMFWLASMVILYYAGKKVFANRQISFLNVCLISFIPVWVDWATKASGGYLTALLFSNIVILLALLKRSLVRTVFISLSLLIIFYAQPLWLVITIPFLAYYFLNNFKFKPTILFVSGSFLLWLITRALLRATDFNYQLQNKLGLGQLARNFKNIFSDYSIAYSGQFFDAVVLKMNTASTICGGFFVVLLLAAVTFDLYLLIRRRLNKIEITFLGSVVLYIVFMLFYSEAEFSHRYLLPIFIPSIFLIVLAAKRLSRSKLNNLVWGFLSVYAVFSLVCGVLFYNYVFAQPKDGYSEVERIEFLNDYLTSKQVVCAYTMDWIISQHFNYFINDVVNRSQTTDSRRPMESAAVDQLYKQGGNCALVGLWYQLPAFVNLYNLRDIFIVSGRYVIYLNPQRDELLKLGFKLSE